MAAWVYPALMAGTAIVGGLLGDKTAKQNARAAKEWAEYNAAQAINYAEFNANAVESLASINAQLVGFTSEMNASLTESLAKYNATIRVQTAEYNAQLMEKEAELVWNAQELDQIIFQREAEYRQNTARAKFASAGIEINTGAPVNYIIDMSTQAKLESFIMRHNADIQVGKLLDAAALGRWQGEAEASAMIYEANLESLSLRTQGKMQMSQINVQGAYDAMMERFSGQVRANHLLYEGEWTSSQYEQSGTQSLLTGLFQGGSWAAKAYEFNTVYGSEG